MYWVSIINSLRWGKPVFEMNMNISAANAMQCIEFPSFIMKEENGSGRAHLFSFNHWPEIHIRIQEKEYK